MESKLFSLKDRRIHRSKTMSKNNRNKKPGQKIPVAPGTEGQNPFWPGEGAQQPGEFEDGKEKVKIPIVDSIREPAKES